MAEVQMLYACSVFDEGFYETHKERLDGPNCAITRARTAQELGRKMDGSHDLVIVFGTGKSFIEAICTARDADIQTPVFYLYTVFVPEEVPGMESMQCTEHPSEIDAAVERLLKAAS